jgi:hypothetical protein
LRQVNPKVRLTPPARGRSHVLKKSRARSVLAK